VTRPPSIVLFERLYLGSLALYLINSAVFWSSNRAIAMSTPQVQASPEAASMVGVIMVASLAITAGISLLFWWLVARQRSTVGKWLVVATEVIGALFGLFALFQLVRGVAPNVPSAALGIVSTALAVVAAIVLFRPDATAWLGEEDAGTPQP
jgi:hypothetical protein